ncbi:MULTISPECIES: hypothetical protein [unclassified Duganella]|uniref:hypothetical protein n=1 Tax=unclassified Duganella TaxID=2636909 RepID=UPI00088B0969|nr:MULTISPECIES: hypothetical protein [unclassified Duganella]SDG85097.1 hypothetical protein SAMN05216320_107289 [Duganella sp. OV458]SDK12494.1 hypothetical protein SAMN05428973_108290 [Duganella sp. OV510]
MPADEATEVQRHEDMQRRLAEVERRLDKMASDVHAMKGNMAGNTALTQETLAGVDAIKQAIAQLDIPSLREMAEAMNSMKGGVKVLGWLERPAKWVAAIAGAVAALYALWKLK